MRIFLLVEYLLLKLSVSAMCPISHLFLLAKGLILFVTAVSRPLTTLLVNNKFIICRCSKVITCFQHAVRQFWWNIPSLQ